MGLLGHGTESEFYSKYKQKSSERFLAVELHTDLQFGKILLAAVQMSGDKES